MTMRVFAVTFSLAALARAYGNSYPVVTWSNDKSFTLAQPPSHAGFTTADSVATHVVAAQGLCDHSNIVIVHWPNLHISDLAQLDPEHTLPQSIVGSRFNAIVPHVTEPTEEMAKLHASIAKTCAAELTTLDDEFDRDAEDALGFSKRTDGKHVVHFNMKPIVWDGGRNRRAEIEEGATFLSRALPEGTTFTLVLGVRGPKTTPAPSIFSQYQLLSPGLITSGLVVLGITIPLLYVAIRALSSVQNSVRTETFKVSQTKKEQ